MREKNIKLKNVEWYENIEYAYTDSGKEDKVFEASVKMGNTTISITVYPLTLFDKDERGWDYRIIKQTNNGKIIEEYDAGVEHEKHFKNAYEAKNASLVTLKEMLEE